MPPSPSRTRAERRGRLGETLAALYLRLKGYRIRARRFKTPVGEIDLVASRFGTLVFIEVKTRASGADEAMALQSVNQRRIIRAAKFYIAKHPYLSDKPMQFDVMFLAPGHLPGHLKNAFEDPER